MAPPGADFTSAVLELVADIPPGCAMSYGDVAAVLGSRGARAVGMVMARSGAEVPWWRVIRSSGHPAIGHEQRALEHFRVEGTPLIWAADGASYRVAPSARWTPR